MLRPSHLLRFPACPVLLPLGVLHLALVSEADTEPRGSGCPRLPRDCQHPDKVLQPGRSTPCSVCSAEDAQQPGDTCDRQRGQEVTAPSESQCLR